MRLLLQHPFSRKSLPLLMAIGLALSGCGEAGKSVEEYISNAEAHCKQEKLKACEIELKNALQKSPDSVKARFLLGKLYYKIGNYPGASKEFRHAWLGDQTSSEVYSLFAKSMLKSSESENLINKSSEISTDSPTLATLKKVYSAEAQLQLGHKEDAQALLTDILNSDHIPTPAKILDARFKAINGKFDQAIKILDGVLEQEPTSVDALFLQADIYKEKNDIAQVEKNYSTAINRIKDTRSFEYFLAQRGLAYAQVLRNQPEQAANTVASIEKGFFKRLVKEDSLLIYVRALIAYSAKDLEQAKTLGDSILAYTQSYPGLLFLLGTINADQDNLEQAESQLNQFLQLFPNNQAARKILSYVHIKKDNPKQALETLKPSVNAESDLPTLKLIANTALKSGDIAASKEYFTKALNKAPQDPTLRLGLVRSLISEENYEAAINELNELAKDEKNHVFANLSIVSVQIKSGDYSAALKTIEQLDEEAQSQPLVKTMHATILLAQGKTNAGKKALIEALDKQKGYVPALRQLAVLSAKEGRTDEATAYFEKAVQSEPKNTKLVNEFASYLSFLQKEDDALHVLREIQRLNPTQETALNIASHLLNNQAPSQAITTLEPFKETGNEKIYNLLGHAYMMQNEFTQALDAYSKAEQINPKSAFIHYLKATSLAALERNEEARRSLNMSLQINPDAVPTAIALGKLDARDENFTSALQIFNKALKQQPENAELLILTANIKERMGEIEKAQDLYIKAFNIKPNKILVEKIVAIYIQVQEPKKALAFLEQALPRLTRHTDLENLLASLYIEQGQTDNAVTLLRKVLSTDAKDIKALNNLAWLLKESDTEEAYQLAQRALRLDPNNEAIKDTLQHIQALR